MTVGISDNGSLIGSPTFSGRFTGQNGSFPGGVADLLLGFPTAYAQDSNTIFNKYQDTIRLTPATIGRSRAS
jgi:hypothetical protein